MTVKKMTDEQAEAFQTAIISIVSAGYDNIICDLDDSDVVCIMYNDEDGYDFTFGAYDGDWGEWTFDITKDAHGVEYISKSVFGVLTGLLGPYSTDKIKKDGFIEKLYSIVDMTKI